jgi:hypothetical protein
MSSFFQSLSAAFASFNSSPRLSRSDNDPQRPLDERRRNSFSQRRAHSPSPRRRPPPSPTAGSRRRIKRAKNEFSLGLEDDDDDDDHRPDLSFQSPRDIAAPQVCTSLHKLSEHLVCFDSVLSQFQLAAVPFLALRYTASGEETDPPLVVYPVDFFFFPPGLFFSTKTRRAARSLKVMPTNLPLRLDLSPPVDNCGIRLRFLS